jgi:hypothetical protein
MTVMHTNPCGESCHNKDFIWKWCFLKNIVLINEKTRSKERIWWVFELLVDIVDLIFELFVVFVRIFDIILVEQWVAFVENHINNVVYFLILFELFLVFRDILPKKVLQIWKDFFENLNWKYLFVMMMKVLDVEVIDHE